MQLKQKNKNSFDNYQLRFDIYSVIGFKSLNSYLNYVPPMHENVSDTASPLDDTMT